MSMTDQEIIDTVACGFCPAKRGEGCIDTRTGRPTRRPHPSRRESAGWKQVGDYPDQGGDEFRYDLSEDQWP